VRCAEQHPMILLHKQDMGLGGHKLHGVSISAFFHGRHGQSVPHHRCSLQTGLIPSSNPQALLHAHRSTSVLQQVASSCGHFAVKIACSCFKLCGELQSSKQENAAALFHRNRASKFASLNSLRARTILSTCTCCQLLYNWYQYRQ